MKIKEISAGKTYLIRKNILRNGIDLPYKFKEDFESEYWEKYFDNNKPKH